MSAKKLILLTAVVAALFAFIFLFERKMPSTAERQRKGDLYWDLPEEHLTRFVIQRGAETLEFDRPDGGRWKMVKPEAYPADAFAVNGAAADLMDLKRAAGDATDGSEAKAEDYGFDKPAAVVTLTWTDPDDAAATKTRTIAFGAAIPGTDITSARVEGQTKVLFVPSAALTALKKPVDDFRSRDVFDGSTSDVTRVEIVRGRGRLLLARRDGAWWLSEPVADLADGAEAERLVRQLTGLRVRDFLPPGEDLAARSLQPPLYRVSLTGEKGAVTAVDFGATRSDGNSIYARRDGQVLTVERDIVDELSKESEPFRSAALVSINRGDVTELDGAFGDAKYALKQENGGWSAGGKAVLAAAADDALNALSGLKGRGFVDEAQVKALGAAPAATVTVKSKGGPGWVVAFHPREGDALATVTGRPGGIVVDAGAAAQVEAALKKAVTPPPAPSPKPTGKA